MQIAGFKPTSTELLSTFVLNTYSTICELQQFGFEAHCFANLAIKILGGTDEEAF